MLPSGFKWSKEDGTLTFGIGSIAIGQSIRRSAECSFAFCALRFGHGFGQEFGQGFDQAFGQVFGQVFDQACVIVGQLDAILHGGLESRTAD